MLLLATLALTLATPGPVAGMALELAYRWFPPIYDSPLIVIMAQSIRTLPYALLILWPAVADPPRRAAGICRPGRPWPLGPALARGSPTLASCRSRPPGAWPSCWAFGELPATNLLQPPGITTITFRIWTLLHTGVESHLAGVALVTLAVLAFVSLSAVLGLRFLFLSDR